MHTRLVDRTRSPSGVAEEVRIMGSKSEPLRTLVAASSATTTGLAFAVLYGAPRPMKMGTIASPWRHDSAFNSRCLSQVLPDAADASAWPYSDRGLSEGSRAPCAPRE
jgi:hypothetical protein